MGQLDAELSKVSNRIDTARVRGDELWWQNHRESYSKRTRRVRALHRKLKHELARNTELSELLEDMQDALTTVCTVEGSTEAKHLKFQELKEEWDEFQESIDNAVRTEHDIFRERNIPPDPDLCFVLMPFDKKYASLYAKVIKPVVRRNGLHCERADNIFSAAAIVQDVWVSINKARIVIADMTGRNSNVFYEIGLSHALRQPVILLSQERKDIPFDVRHIRYIFYKDTKTGRKALSSKLAKTIKNLLK